MDALHYFQKNIRRDIISNLKNNINKDGKLIITLSYEKKICNSIESNKVFERYFFNKR